MGPSTNFRPVSHLQIWSWKDCTSQNCRILFSFKTVLAMYDQETFRNKGQPSYSRLKTAVRLHIDQAMRARSCRARNEIVERGMVTKSQKEKNLRWKESGRMLSVEGNWTMFERKLCSSVMIQHLETDARLKDRKDSNPLPHLIRRQGLTVKKSFRQKRSKFFGCEMQNSVPL